MNASDAISVVGRFAPSPSGRMHAGNIFASLMVWLVAKAAGGQVVLRIEDLDTDRSKREYIEAIPRDYELLGLTWDRGPYYQHNRTEAYREAYSLLDAQGLIYPCYCSRAEIVASAPHRGEKTVYAGTCRHLTMTQREQRAQLKDPGYRLMVDNRTITIEDLVQGRYAQRLDQECGDFLLRRADGAFAYQLAVVLDDAEQGVNSVVRGVDLLCSTPQQVYLQQLLGLPHPRYAHVPLFVSESDRRLSKRDHDAGLDVMLGAYRSPEGVIGHIAYVAGLIDTDRPESPQTLLEQVDMETLDSMFPDKIQIPWRA